MSKSTKKYNDEDTKKPGSPIETPYKYSDVRRKEIIITELESEVDSEVEVIK